jgi:hypothetical protein
VRRDRIAGGAERFLLGECLATFVLPPADPGSFASPRMTGFWVGVGIRVRTRFPLRRAGIAECHTERSECVAERHIHGVEVSQESWARSCCFGVFSRCLVFGRRHCGFSEDFGGDGVLRFAQDDRRFKPLALIYLSSTLPGTAIELPTFRLDLATAGFGIRLGLVSLLSSIPSTAFRDRSLCGRRRNSRSTQGACNHICWRSLRCHGAYVGVPGGKCCS